MRECARVVPMEISKKYSVFLRTKLFKKIVVIRIGTFYDWYKV